MTHSAVGVLRPKPHIASAGPAQPKSGNLDVGRTTVAIHQVV